MKISVIIPTYNSADTIELTLESVFAQTYTDFEVIVVDDASTDDTVAVVEKNLSADFRRFPQIKNKIIELKENMGPAGARNAGIEVAEGEWIAFLDGDDLWPAYKLEVQLWEMEKCDDAVMSCGFAPSFGSDEELGKNYKLQITNYDKDYNKSISSRGINITDFEETNPVATSSVMVKRQVVLDVGGFDERFRGPEDMDLWLRIVANNKVVLFGVTLALYRERAGSLCMDSTKFLKEVLKVYDKAFAEGGAMENCAFKKRTIATRYTSAAWGALNDGNRIKAMHYLLKSWIVYSGKIVHELRYPHWRLKLLRKIIFNIRDAD